MKNYAANSNTTNYTEFREGISGHGIIIAILSGIICQMTLYLAMNVSMLDIPIMFTILLWFIFAGFTGLFMDYLGV